MHTFRVWAPRARTVAVRIGDASYSLQPSEHSWWTGEVEEARPGSDYWFVVDGGDPIPDPRSQFQPFGIAGPSRLVDHSSFRWSDGSWQAKELSGAIVYELHIGTFTADGTFTSTIERLNYLAGLGITHLNIMPVNEFSGDRGWGYDGVDLYAPHHAYGTPDDLKSLVNACHEKGLAVILDVVYNHLGPAGNYLDSFGPYFTSAYKTPWGPAVNLDHRGSMEVRRFFVDNALMWLRDYHFDGLRLDAVHAFYDRSAIHFLEYLSKEVEALALELGRYLVLIAESDLNDPRIVTARESGGFGIDAQWSDDFHHALHSVLTGEVNGYYQDFGSLHHLAKALQRAYVYDGVYSRHRDRIHGRPLAGLSGRRFFGFAQNHDQVGNRARGERLSQLISTGRQKIAAALVLTSPFIPMLFQGEEFGASTPFQYFTHHEDRELASAVSEGRRSEFAYFGWEPEEIPDPQDFETFQRSKLRWSEIGYPPHDEILAWYRTLIAVRRTDSQLTDGNLEAVQVSYDEGALWLVMKRGDFEVVCNLMTDRQTISITQTKDRVLCSESDYQIRPGFIDLPAESVAILR